MSHLPVLSTRGSSPHTRGAPRPRRLGCIPRRDHPRIRGEHVAPARRPRQSDGIIPAYAGSTKNYFSLKPISAGSSPHTRGALRCLGPVQRSQRIIPAYAGSTLAGLSCTMPREGSSPHTRGAPERPIGTSPTRRDHPRIRGEHSLPEDALAHGVGIIPAYAGSTAVMYRSQVMATGSSPHTRGARRPRGRCRWRRGDHPRIRGEHGEEAADEGREGGIIPAYAGSTSY